MKQPVFAGVDTGGTFTDFVVLEGDRLRTHKQLSTPEDPAIAIIRGLDHLGIKDQPLLLVHGTTMATNAVLQGKGARVAYLCNQGFTDLLSIGRQQRPLLYHLQQPAPASPVPEQLCIGLKGRISSDGEILEALDDKQISELPGRLAALGVDSVAINLLFSFLRPDQEQAVASQLGKDWFVSCSSRVVPEIREYERGIACWLNASVGPLLEQYLTTIRQSLPTARISVMQSAGTTISAQQAADQAVRLLLSGPAGGLAAASFIGSSLGESRLLTFDMGGTSTDVALIDGDIRLTRRGRVAGFPVVVPMVDMHTIGAGGGSLARIDEGGSLQVGPESAGADPGPASYGRGGRQATVTDAHVVLGRLPLNTRLGNGLSLDAGRAHKALAGLGSVMGVDALEAARGVIRLANEHMARALRVISVERGYDPASYRLFSFGGAGGLHTCDLSDLLGIKRAIVPANSGVLSALGMLVGRPGRVLTRSILATADQLTEAQLGDLYKELEQEGRASMQRDGYPAGQIITRPLVEIRYRGQSQIFSLPVAPLEDLTEALHSAHQERYGHRLDLPVELVNARLHLAADAAISELPEFQFAASARRDTVEVAELGTGVPCRLRRELTEGQVLTGPMIILDQAATSWIKPGWQVQCNGAGHLLLEHET